jgi:GNAT superfamily N-acetyltransferase
MAEFDRMPALATRRATLDDVPVLTETQRQGFAGYATFLPAGWTPPASETEAQGIRDRLEQPGAWCVIAQAGAEIAGHTGFLPARESDEMRTPIPGLAHLWALFVREPWWGSGVAHELHGLALAEALARGYRSMRLFTPAGQARARRFYEREGWTTDGVERWEPMLAFDLVEYRRGLPGSQADAAPA